MAERTPPTSSIDADPTLVATLQRLCACAQITVPQGWDFSLIVFRKGHGLYHATSLCGGDGDLMETLHALEKGMKGDFAPGVSGDGK